IMDVDGGEWLGGWWLRTNRAYQDVMREHPRSHVVVHEDLCRDPLAGTRDIFAFLGWEVGRQTSRFIEQSSRRSRSSLATMLLGQHPYFGIYRDSRESIDNWATTLTET